MNLQKILTEKKTAIINRWSQILLETYPVDTQRFFKKQKDQFANPVGYIIKKEIENLFEGLLVEFNPEGLSLILDKIIRVRAIQNFSASQAVAFIFPLKKIIRMELGKKIVEPRISDDLLILESKIDDLCLLAFDIYMKCCKKLYELRADQLKNQVSGLLVRTGLVSEIPEWEAPKKEVVTNHL